MGSPGSEGIKRSRLQTCLRASRFRQTHSGLRRVLMVMIVGLCAAQAPAFLAPSATAKHDNNSAIPKAPVDRAAQGDTVPEGLSTSDWSSIRAAYDARRHAAFAVDDGYQVRNPGQRWRTRFDGRGFLTTPDGGGWSWGLKLLSYGREGAQQMVTAPSRVEADGGRVSYPWDDTLTEWYVNDRRGLEHGYTIQRRPACVSGRPRYSDQSPDREGGVGSQSQRLVRSGSDRSLTVAARKDTGDGSLTVAARKDAPLQLTLAVRGGLHPRVSAGGRGVTFVKDSGAAVVNYHGLSVVDADGAALPARFEAPGTGSTEAHGEVRGEALVLHVDDRNARYPLTIDPIAQQAYLKASNTDGGDGFGLSVAVSGDTVVVGAFETSNATGVDGNQADNSLTFAGAAYVFFRDAGGVWSQQAYLKASNTDFDDRFGHSVAVSGDTVVVGAQREASSATGVNGNQGDNSASQGGAAYVFVRDSGGVWSQQAYLKASNTDGGDQFGWSVAVSGDTVVVGAWLEDSNGTGVTGDGADNSARNAGAAYVFVRDAGGVWIQQAYFKASNTDAFDFFGFSVAVSGDTVVVGARSEASSATGVDGNQADNSSNKAGAAYVFVRGAAGVWSQQAYLKASNTDILDRFGHWVAVSGDTVVVAAITEGSSATGVDGNQADNSAPDTGAAYVFVRDAGGVWSQQAYLKASNTDIGDGFGNSVAVSGDTVVVGAKLEASSATGVNGNQADNSASVAGAAYVFVRDAGGVWSQPAYLKASNTDGGDQFGFSVAVAGDTVVVGAGGESSIATGVNGNQADNSAQGAGAAYVFRLPCGDGILDPGEACDDANATEGDGCSSTCTIEPGFVCTGQPSLCGLDCNGNGIPDATDIANATSQDCNNNAIPDECEIDANSTAPGGPFFCLANCDPDCNNNGVPDQCDCRVPTEAVADTIANASGTLVPSVKSRFLSFSGGDPGLSQAVLVTFVSLPGAFSVFDGTIAWVDMPFVASELPGKGLTDPVGGDATFLAARLTASPVFADWSTFGVVHVFDERIIPSRQLSGQPLEPAIYDVQLVAEGCFQLVFAGCSINIQASFSPPLTITNARWADLAQLAGGEFRAPDGSVAIDDTLAMLAKFSGAANAPIKARAELLGVGLSGPVPAIDGVISVSDLLEVLAAFSGGSYPFPPPAP